MDTPNYPPAGRLKAVRDAMAACDAKAASRDDPRPPANEFKARRDLWSREIRPVGEGARWALDRAVAASIRIEKCEDAHDALAVEGSARARLCWDQDRRVAAAALMDGLARRPMLSASRLEATKQGVEMMLEAWAQLGRSIEAKGDWSDEEASRALDLMGVPTGSRDGRTAIEPAPTGDVGAHRKEVVRRESERLNRRLFGALDELDRIERTHAATAATAVLSPEARRLHRHENEAWRRYRESMRAARAKAVEQVAPPEGSEVDDGPAAGTVPRSMMTSVERAPAEVDFDAEDEVEEVEAEAMAEVAAPSRTMNRRRRRAMAAMGRRR